MMKVVLLRHATRPHHESGDCSLTVYGQIQAEALARAIAPQGVLPPPTRLLASPKKRARQTLTPLAHQTQLRLEIETRLDERHHNETAHEFETRIRLLIDGLTKQAESGEGCIYVCSHFDWLETATLLVPSDASENELVRGWSTCEYLVFRINQGLWQVINSGVVAPR